MAHVRSPSRLSAYTPCQHHFPACPGSNRAAYQMRLRNASNFFSSCGSNSSFGCIRTPFWNRPRPKTIANAMAGSLLRMASIGTGFVWASVSERNTGVDEERVETRLFACRKYNLVVRAPVDAYEPRVAWMLFHEVVRRVCPAPVRRCSVEHTRGPRRTVL